VAALRCGLSRHVYATPGGYDQGVLDEELSGERTRYVLLWMERIGAHELLPVRRAIEDTVVEDRDEVEVDVWLESPGGDAHAAYKLALILRHVACCVRIVVPDYAKSAATLLALVGDEIYLAPGAELGPLDAQIPEEGHIHGVISALNIARAADEVARDAVALAGRGGAELLYRTGLSRAETLNAMLRFSASFSEPLVRQLDPRLVHQAKELLRVTTRYATQLLERTVGPRAEEIAQKLVEDFPTHGFVISYDDAEELGLPVRPIGEYDLLATVRSLHRTVEDTGDVVHFAPMDEFLAADKDDEKDGGDDEQPRARDTAESERDGPAADQAGDARPEQDFGVEAAGRDAGR
jgi:hypothetical protein